MKNTIGNNVTLSVFGESHGKTIGATLDGLPSGIAIDVDFIKNEMNKRKAKGKISTSRKEDDEINIVSGVFNGFTTGMPLTILINNNNVVSKDYEKTKDIARPGHADFSASEKYFGFQDYRGGGHFSGRLTSVIVAVGAICRKALLDKGIILGSHIKQLYNLNDREFNNLKGDLLELYKMEFAVLDETVKNKMIKLIEDTKDEGDSVGGIVETVVINLPSGLGDPMFDSVEGSIAKALFGIGAVKGVEFGEGFGFAVMKGSLANDEFMIEEGKIKTKTNHNGGVNGGISNGMPLVVKSVIKPTPSIGLDQNSVNLKTKEETVLQIRGRHDPAIIHRAVVVIDNLISIVLMDLLVTRYGQDWSKIL